MSGEKQIALERRLAADDDAPRHARDLAAEMIDRLGAGTERSEDLALIVSELVTNALLHGEGHVALRLHGSSRQIRVEVADDGTTAFAWPDPGRDGHWGLDLVGAFSERAGVVRTPATLVWCELDL